MSLSFTATPKKVEQATCREILWIKQCYPAIVTEFPLLQGKQQHLQDHPVHHRISLHALHCSGAKKKIPVLVSSNQKAKIYCDLLSIFGKICTACSRPSSIISDASHWDNLHKNVTSFTIILWWMHNEGKLIFRRGVHNFHKQEGVWCNLKFMFFKKAKRICQNLPVFLSQV